MALVVPRDNAETALDAYRQRLSSALDWEQFAVSVVVLSPDDILRLAVDEVPWWRNLVAEAQSVLGLPPASLAEQLRSNRASGGSRAA